MGGALGIEVLTTGSYVVSYQKTQGRLLSLQLYIVHLCGFVGHDGWIGWLCGIWWWWWWSSFVGERHQPPTAVCALLLYILPQAPHGGETPTAVCALLLYILPQAPHVVQHKLVIYVDMLTTVHGSIHNFEYSV